MRAVVLLIGLSAGGCHALFGLGEVALPPDAATFDTPAEGVAAWQPPVLVTLDVPAGTYATDVSLTADESRIAYTVATTSLYDLYEAALVSPTMTGARTSILMTPDLEASPELSPDGKTLYFITHESGSSVGVINMATRTDAGTWESFTQPAELNAATRDDRPGSPDATGRYMVIGRAGAVLEMMRAASEGPWTQIDTCDAINASALRAIRNAHMTADGLRLAFAAAVTEGAGNYDVYVSSRAAIGDPWGAPERFELSASGVDDSDPWLSAHGTRMWWSRGQAVVFSELR